MTDFDQAVNRRDSLAMKWNQAELIRHFGSDDLLPLWVADMEFMAPPAVCEQLAERARNGVFGYESKPDSLYDAITNWHLTRHGWSVDRSELCFSRGIMNAVSALINLHTDEGDGIIIQPPVFMEFRSAIRNNNRKVIRNSLLWQDGRYQMDLDDLEEKTRDPHTKMLILCNPHNPVGRVWTRDELEQVGEICRANHVLVIADEIHGDFVFDGHTYIPFATVSTEDAQNSFTCFSPAKTFNIAAVTDGLVVIPNHDYRERYKQFFKRYSINKTDAFSVVAMETAYRTSSDWLDELVDYLQRNIEYLRRFLKQHLPEVRLVEPEGTFLVWLDFRDLAMDAKQLEKFLATKAKLAINPGYWFGREGAGYARMTIACPKPMLQDALLRLQHAVTGHFNRDS